MNRPSLLGWGRGLAGAVRHAVAVMVDPNRATREGLRDIARTLREAGWDAPPAPAEAFTDEQLEHLRTASARFLRPDDLRVIQAVVADRRSLTEVAADLHRSPDELNRQLVQALHDLANFAREAQPTSA